jgi:hypothetical protein
VGRLISSGSSAGFSADLVVLARSARLIGRAPEVPSHTPVLLAELVESDAGCLAVLTAILQRSAKRQARDEIPDHRVCATARAAILAGPDVLEGASARCRAGRLEGTTHEEVMTGECGTR